MKIKSALSSRRRRSPTTTKSAPEVLPKQPGQPDMLSKILLLTPATDESRAAAETTNESDESRTAAATANESIEMVLKTAVDASINSTFFSPRPQAKSVPESKPTASEPDETKATPTTASEPDESQTAAAFASKPDESQTAAATASEPDMFSVLSGVISEAKSIGDDLSRLLAEEVKDLKTTAEPTAAVLSSVISEAKNFGDDASRLIGEQVEGMKTETKSVIKSTAKEIAVELKDWREHLNQTQTAAESVSSAEGSVSSEQNKLTGHSHCWAKEIKKLGQLQRKKEKTEEKITKCDEQITIYENIISTLEEELVETRKTIKVLHQIAMPSGGSNMSYCATEVKKLGQLEQKKKKAEKQLAKADKEMTELEKTLSVTEQKHQETMKNINFLSKNNHCDGDSVSSWESRV